MLCRAVPHDRTPSAWRALSRSSSPPRPSPPSPPPPSPPSALRPRLDRRAAAELPRARVLRLLAAQVDLHRLAVPHLGRLQQAADHQRLDVPPLEVHHAHDAHAEAELQQRLLHLPRVVLAHRHRVVLLLDRVELRLPRPLDAALVALRRLHLQQREIQRRARQHDDDGEDRAQQVQVELVGEVDLAAQPHHRHHREVAPHPRRHRWRPPPRPRRRPPPAPPPPPSTTTRRRRAGDRPGAARAPPGPASCSPPPRCSSPSGAS